MDDRIALLMAYLDRRIAGTEQAEPANDIAEAMQWGRLTGLREVRAWVSGIAGIPYMPEERTAEQAAAIAAAADLLP